MLIETPLQAGIDLELPVIVRQTNKKGDVIPASDFISAEFSIYTTNRNQVLTKSLGSGIVVEDVDGNNLFVVSFTSAETSSLEGVYLVDLVVEDASNITSMPIHDQITFKPRLGV